MVVSHHRCQGAGGTFAWDRDVCEGQKDAAGEGELFVFATTHLVANYIPPLLHICACFCSATLFNLNELNELCFKIVVLCTCKNCNHVLRIAHV